MEKTFVKTANALCLAHKIDPLEPVFPRKLVPELGKALEVRKIVGREDHKERLSVHCDVAVILKSR